MFHVRIDGVPRCAVPEANSDEITAAATDLLQGDCSFITFDTAQMVARFVANFFEQRNQLVTVDVAEGDCPVYFGVYK